MPPKWIVEARNLCGSILEIKPFREVCRWADLRRGPFNRWFWGEPKGTVTVMARDDIQVVVSAGQAVLARVALDGAHEARRAIQDRTQ